jgi:hypothetical protein
MTTCIARAPVPHKGLAPAGELLSYHFVAFPKTRAFWVDDDALDAAEDVASLAELGNLSFNPAATSAEILVSKQGVESFPLKRTRFSGGQIHSVKATPIPAEDVGVSPDGRSIGLLLARHREALEILLLLAGGSATIEEVMSKMAGPPTILAGVTVELERLGLVAVQQGHVALSAKGLEVVNRLRESTRIMKESHA